MSGSDEEILRFIAASFPSVWTLELLLALKREQRTWQREELVATLRASELVVSNALDALVAAGLASIEGEGAVYVPVSSSVGNCVERAEQLYRTRSNEVRRTIVSAGKSSAVAFANAFKIRRERDD